MSSTEKGKWVDLGRGRGMGLVVYSRAQTFPSDVFFQHSSAVSI